MESQNTSSVAPIENSSITYSLLGPECCGVSFLPRSNRGVGLVALALVLLGQLLLVLGTSQLSLVAACDTFIQCRREVYHQSPFVKGCMASPGPDSFELGGVFHLRVMMAKA